MLTHFFNTVFEFTRSDAHAEKIQEIEQVEDRAITPNAGTEIHEKGPR